jgi:hypothetical protein
MMHKNLLCFLLIFGSNWSIFAQKSTNRLRLGLEIGATPVKNAGLNLHFRFDEKSDLNFSTTFFGYNEVKKSDLFFGDRIVNYGRTKTDTVYFYNPPFLKGSSGWQFLDQARPFPNSVENAADFSIQNRLGFKFNFEKKGRNWSAFMQPSAILTYFRYIKITDTQSYIYDKTTETEISNGLSFRIKEFQTTQIIEETRRMQLREKWIYGISYGFGATFHPIWSRYFIDLRTDLGLNLNEAYFQYQPTPVSRFWWRPSVTVGVVFGDLPPKPAKLPKPKKRVVESL